MYQILALSLLITSEYGTDSASADGYFQVDIFSHELPKMYISNLRRAAIPPVSGSSSSVSLTGQMLIRLKDDSLHVTHEQALVPPKAV